MIPKTEIRLAGLVLVLACSCAAPQQGRSGASIALIGGGAQVAVVNPDQGSISLLDPGTLARPIS